MAKVLQDFTIEGRGRGESRDWDALFDGKVHELERGKTKDFEVKVESFRNAAHAAARKRGGKLTSRADVKKGVIQIRFEKNSSGK